MAQLFANAARSTLTASITAGSTQLQINPADQALFPVATGADWFKVALEDSSGNLEFMQVQRAVGQSLLTISARATEDAAKFPARAFVAGSLVELRMTASDLASSIAHPSLAAGAHAASAISVTPAGAIASTTVQAALQELDTEVNAALNGKASLGANTFTGAQTLPGNAINPLEAMPLQQATGRLLAVRVFTIANTGQTYAPTAGTTSVVVQAVGGGGAGGGTPATGTGQTALSNGGSPGSYGASRYTTGFSGVLLTIGAGGTPVTGGNGGNGGTTSFGALLSCPGGEGSGAGIAVSSAQNFSAVSQPLPSPPSGANLFTHLGFAKPGVLCLNGWGYFAGSGGDTLLGSGGQGFGGSFAAQNGSGYGSGGGGVANDASQAAKAGGKGAPGVIIVWEYA